MIQSMTGFGEGTATVGPVVATAEVRSVNARHFDAKVHLPGAMAGRRTQVQALLREHFERGRVSAKVQIEEDQAPETLPITVDEEAAAAYAALLRRLRVAAGLEAPLRIEHLLHFSDVFTGGNDEPTASEEAWSAAREALDQAADRLQQMRRKEGQALHRDLKERLDAIEGGLESIEARVPERLEEAQRHLRERLGEIIQDKRIASERLEAEIALLADKLDVTEECVRLHSHVKQFRETLGDDAPAGRKLKFLTQEIHRETNTIGAKSDDATIAHCTVEMKEEIEKIREQIRNVE